MTKSQLLATIKELIEQYEKPGIARIYGTIQKLKGAINAESERASLVKKVSRTKRHRPDTGRDNHEANS